LYLPLYLRREEGNIDGKKKRHWETAGEKKIHRYLQYDSFMG
jgi:hypothetical protein